jgi:hypothetical protein
MKYPKKTEVVFTRVTPGLKAAAEDLALKYGHSSLPGYLRWLLTREINQSPKA